MKFLNAIISDFEQSIGGMTKSCKCFFGKFSSICIASSPFFNPISKIFQKVRAFELSTVSGSSKLFFILFPLLGPFNIHDFPPGHNNLYKSLSVGIMGRRFEKYYLIFST